MTSPLPFDNPFRSPTSVLFPKEASFAGDVGPGAPKSRARLVQEWVSLHGPKIKIDGDYGPATSTAVRGFQASRGLPPTGLVDRATHELLIAPLTAALQPITPPPGATFGSMTVAYARQHLKQHPREVGGANRGPWVRFYMDGNEGDDQLWCAGFVTLIQKQVSLTLGQPVPIARSVSCDVLAARAKEVRCFEAGCPDFKRITPGSLFLVQKTTTDWQHVGIVTSAEKEAFHTIEGNTNDEGSREGFEACARVRGYEKKDFILVA
jgi:hypothetical protein